MHYFSLGKNSSDKTVIVEMHYTKGPGDIQVPVVDANYSLDTLDANRIIKTTPGSTTSQQLLEVYAYRKIHDMEIHDIGVVYFV